MTKPNLIPTYCQAAEQVFDCDTCKDYDSCHLETETNEPSETQLKAGIHL